MTSAPIPLKQPDAAAVRAQVERMTASSVFRNSPQLATFLWFIVEAQLRGKAERLKGYTIGVEVLRRDTKFDPQVDPIVRVEATRLRRAIERYYAGPGLADEIVISLPRGGYVPRISWRGRGGSVAADAPARPAGEPQPLAPGNGWPTLRVAPFVVAGTPRAFALDGDTLSAKLGEAFALFDQINVVAAAPASGRYDYRLDGTLEYRDDTALLRFKLVDKSDETVIWSRTVERKSANETVPDLERRVIFDLTTTIAQRFGIIWAHDRTRHLASNVGDPRYRAVVEAGESFRRFDMVAYAHARSELERLTVLDPGFSSGFSSLAVIYATEYVHGFADPNDVTALDRALQAARRGVELKPQSAFAYHILFVVLFFRGENEAAAAAAERAMALNPYDVSVTADYGGRLIFSGQVDKGMEILRATVPFGAILPSWTHFYLFLGHYLRDELAEARFHAGQMMSESHVYGQLARALMAHLDGNADEKRRAVLTLVSGRPQWKSKPRYEIGKLITDAGIADRLARDLVAAGLLN